MLSRRMALNLLIHGPALRLLGDGMAANPATPLAAAEGIALLPATRLCALIRDRQIGARQLLDLYLDRVDRFNPTLNALVWIDREGARARAEAADRALRDGITWGPLHGLPMTIKDTIEVAGMPTTAGDPRYAGYVSTSNAPAVQRLIDAGAVIFGRSNAPSSAGDWQSYNALYGTTNNPWDLSRTPGGSSGGAAAALAAGLTALELGSDFGGSLRLPAHFTGVCGHRPTYGLVPYRGHIPPPPGVPVTPEMAVIGPLARSADDLVLALRLLAADPPAESGAARQSTADAPRSGQYRVAAWLDDDYAAVDADMRPAVSAAIASLRQAGIDVDATARPEPTLAEAHAVYRGLVQKVFRGQAPAGLEERRSALHEAWQRFFSAFDVLLAPVAPVTAFAHDHSEPMAERRLQINGAEVDYILALSAWPSLASAAGLPATTVPIGQSIEGLPVGLQIIGPQGGDSRTLGFAAQMDRIVGGFRPPPGFAGPN